MATTVNYANAPRNSVGQISVANSARDGTGTIVSVFAAGTNGSRIDVITVKATATTTAGMVRLFLHDGTNARLWTEVPVTATTPSGTQPSFEANLTSGNLSSLLPLHLQSGWSLRAAPHNAEAFNVIGRGSDF
jgi:hypothetical protein